MRMGVGHENVLGLKHIPISMGECKKRNSKQFKMERILGIIILWKSHVGSKYGPNYILNIYHWKGLEMYLSKIGSHSPFEVMSQ